MNLKISKPKLNLTIDIVMFIVMMPIAGVGFLIKYVLIPGFKRNDVYGKDVELYFWGIDRHLWGTIHLLLSLTLLFLLLLHIIFHWKQIVSIFKNMVSTKVWRIILTTTLVVFSIAFGIMPLFVQPEIKAGVSHHNNHKQKGFAINPKEIQHNNLLSLQSEAALQNSPTHIQSKVEHEYNNKSEVEIFGYMTLNQVANKYHIPAQKLAAFIHIPEKHNDEKLGKLKKRYDFELNDLRTYIEQNK